MKQVLLEVCAASARDVLSAERGGADRAELCANLLVGGTTPSAGEIEAACSQARIPVAVMIRPRGGDFLYTELEFAAMKLDVKAAKACGAAGVVFGVLCEDGRVDRARTSELVALARPLAVTFHRAFDMARDPMEALDVLMALGIDRVLTSGQRASAQEGARMLAALTERAQGRIAVMPGGGINESNIVSLIEETGARHIHVNPREKTPSRMQFQNRRISMSRLVGADEYATDVIGETRVRALVRLLREIPGFPE